MSIYQCCKCCKQFKQKIDYIRHTNRKRPCIEVNTVNIPNNGILIHDKVIPPELRQITPKLLQITPKLLQITPKLLQIPIEKYINLESNNICKYCKKQFSRNFNFIRHKNQNRCKIKKLIDEQNNNKDNMIELLETKYDQQIQELKNINEQQIEELKQTILTLETKIIKSNKKIITTTNSNNTNSNNTNLIIQFGQENTIELLKSNEIAKIINRGYCAIQESVKQTHFNKRLPQFHNIYISNRKYTHGLKYIGGKFELHDIPLLIDDLIDNHRNNIEEYLEMNNIPYKRNMLEKVKDLLEILDNIDNPKRKKTREEIVKELKNMLYNEKNLIDKNKNAIEI